MTQNENLAELSAGRGGRLARRPVPGPHPQRQPAVAGRRAPVVGVTTNPTIFAEAISGSESYDEQLHDLAVRGVSVEEALRTITAADVRGACDVLRPVADATSPATAGSPSRSPRAWPTTPTRPSPRPAHLWWLVDRPNLFIKIPATEAGLPAITDDPRERASASTSP